MHSFLEAIGFEQMNNTQLDKVLNDIMDNPNYMRVAVNSQNHEFIEFSKDYGKSIGISVCGTYKEDGAFCMEYYYPYFIGDGVTSEEKVEIQKHAEKESYAGICDDVKVGVNLIFYLQNSSEYLNIKSKMKKEYQGENFTTLSGMSLSGKIILPVTKNEKQAKKSQQMIQERNHLIAAARDGDEDAIESLTLEDIDLYSMISRRITHEDILSIVDTSFMPYGIESDQYSILGEILNVEFTQNEVTGQRVCILKVDTNNLIYNICINEKNLLGEPLVGRRFKGNIWMQGSVKYNI